METLLGAAPGDNPVSLANGEHVTIISGLPLPFLTPRLVPGSLGLHSLESIGIELRGWNLTGSGALWPVANTAYFIPFGVAQPITVKQLWSLNGGTISTGNVDVGIYDSSGNRKVSKGSTASSGTNTLQVYDVTDTVLQRGRYYLAMASDSSSANQLLFRLVPSNVGIASALGVYEMAAAFPLPDPATFTTITSAYIPMCGLTLAATI